MEQEVMNKKLKLEHVQILEENSGLLVQNQKLSEEASYAKELASAAAVEEGIKWDEDSDERLNSNEDSNEISQAPRDIQYDMESEDSSSMSSVISNEDLLHGILSWLPVTSLVLFKTVSKKWLSIIRDSSFVSRHQSQNLNLQHPFGLLIRRTNVSMKRIEYDFQSFDFRIPSVKSAVFTLGSEAPNGQIGILHSCSGLLLCCKYPDILMVFNPTTKQFKTLPKTPFSHARLAYDPIKPNQYKVIQTVVDGNFIQVNKYCSVMGSWNICDKRFSKSFFQGFENGVFWNYAIHWLNTNNLLSKNTRHFKLDIENDELLFSRVELPQSFDVKSHFQSKIFESRGCLLLLGKDKSRSQHLNVYEMTDSEWSVKFHVNLEDIRNPLHEAWSIPSCIWCIIMGEEEKDSFLIIDLLNEVVQYNLLSKNVSILNGLESLGTPILVSNFSGFQLISSFAAV